MPAMKSCGKHGCPNVSMSAYCDEHTTKAPHGWGSSTREKPPGWDKIRRTILRRDRYKCRMCGEGAAIVDHHLPMAWGGNEDRGNLRTMCFRCHRAKTNAEKRLGKTMNGMTSASRVEAIHSFMREWSTE